jgi:hypothetical protein
MSYVFFLCSAIFIITFMNYDYTFLKCIAKTVFRHITLRISILSFGERVIKDVNARILM